jgi:putative ABC transport system substrate-binding protein
LNEAPGAALKLLQQWECQRSAMMATNTISTHPLPWCAQVKSEVAPSFGVELRPINTRADTGEIERAVAAFARQPNGGLFHTASTGTAARRDVLITLAARHKLPAVYANPYYAASGGLVGYGPNIVDQYRQAAGYVDHILKGEKPADLPVQAPTKYELVINLKTAKALGIDIPTSVLARADEVIE